jgi:hypothetical protein
MTDDEAAATPDDEGSTAGDGAGPGQGDGPAPATPAAGRPGALELARIHVRLGSLALARAELESLAGRGMLDEDALLDLAEVRWRTGDLAGAGEAATAFIARGRGDALALVIAAEAIAALGRPSEARRLAARALDAIVVPLDSVFAGMPRSPIWPGEAAPSGRAATAGGAPAVAAPAAAAEAFAGGRAALGAGDRGQAALRLGVALRLEPEFAQAVLNAIGERPDDPGLALVAGDALRLLGRETEARAAFDLARGGAPARASAPSAGSARRTTGDPGISEADEDDD